jgi:dihydrofolate reductase
MSKVIAIENVTLPGVMQAPGRLGKDLVVPGSGQLVQSLMRRGLVDQLVLLIHPLVLRSGRRLLADGGPNASHRLVDARTTPPTW